MNQMLNSTVESLLIFLGMITVLRFFVHFDVSKMYVCMTYDSKYDKNSEKIGKRVMKRKYTY